MINSNVVEESNTKSANKVVDQQKKLSFRIVHETYHRTHDGNLAPVDALLKFRLQDLFCYQQCPQNTPQRHVLM